MVRRILLPLFLLAALVRPLVAVSAVIEVREPAHAPARLWVNQSAVVSVGLVAASPFAVFETTSRSEGGFNVTPLPVERRELTDGRHLYQLGWRVAAQRAGDLTLELPPIHYRESGLVRFTYTPPPAVVAVQTLPAYLPPTIPVGRLRLEVTPPLLPWVTTGRLHQLHLLLEGDGVPVERLPRIEGQLENDAAIHFYPAVLAEKVSGNSSQRRYTIPYRVDSIGSAAVSPLRLHYFDPDVGRLVSVTVPLDLPSALPLWLVVLGECALALLSWPLVTRASTGSMRVGRRWLNYRRALGRIQRAQSFDELRSGVADLAKAEGWAKQLTLRQFACQWQLRFGGDEAWDGLLAVLDEVGYARERSGCVLPTAELLRVVRGGRPLLSRSARVFTTSSSR